jgi:hypothetical protein
MSDYDTDVVAWSDQQAGLLRRRAAGELVNDREFDWPNIAEEIGSVGLSERLALRSHIATVLEHLIKLLASPATEPRNGWKTSVLQARGRIRRILKSSPSLRREVAVMIVDETLDVCRDVAATLAIYGEQPVVPVEALTFTEEQVMGSWFLDEPALAG